MNITTTSMLFSPLSVFAFGPFGPLEDLARKLMDFFRRLQFSVFCCNQKAKRAVRSHMDYVINGESGIGTIEMVLILVENYIYKKHVFYVYICTYSSLFINPYTYL